MYVSQVSLKWRPTYWPILYWYSTHTQATLDRHSTNCWPIYRSGGHVVDWYQLTGECLLRCTMYIMMFQLFKLQVFIRWQGWLNTGYHLYHKPMYTLILTQCNTKVSIHIHFIGIVTYFSCRFLRIKGWDVKTAKFRTKWTSSFQTENEWPKAITTRTIIGSVLVALFVCNKLRNVIHSKTLQIWNLTFAQPNYYKYVCMKNLMLLNYENRN